MGRKSKEEGIYEYIWLINFAVQKQLTNQCKAVILQWREERKVSQRTLGPGGNSIAFWLWREQQDCIANQLPHTFRFFVVVVARSSVHQNPFWTFPSPVICLYYLSNSFFVILRNFGQFFLINKSSCWFSFQNKSYHFKTKFKSKCADLTVLPFASLPSVSCGI